jgi:hypothetical protein
MFFALLIQGNERKWESEFPRLWVWRLRYYIIRSGIFFSRLQQSLRDACPKSVVWMAEVEATSSALNSINFYQNTWCHILVPFLLQFIITIFHTYLHCPLFKKEHRFSEIRSVSVLQCKGRQAPSKTILTKTTILNHWEQVFWRTQMNMCLCTTAYGEGNRSHLQNVVFLLEQQIICAKLRNMAIWSA